MQSRRLSLIEACTSTAIGFVVATATQIAVFPLFGLHTSLGENMQIGAIFTAVSIARSYLVRRLFETVHVKAPFLRQADRAEADPGQPRQAADQ
jgi:hypothetical protein